MKGERIHGRGNAMRTKKYPLIYNGITVLSLKVALSPYMKYIQYANTDVSANALGQIKTQISGENIF